MFWDKLFNFFKMTLGLLYVNIPYILYIYFKCIFYIKGEISTLWHLGFVYIMFLYNGLIMALFQGRNYLPRNEWLQKSVLCVTASIGRYYDC
jgi:hypothetical protein